MSAPPRIIAAVALGLSLCLVTAEGTGAADGRLYPSGPPNGVAYLRFANLSTQRVTVASPAAELALPSDNSQRVRQYDPVTPGTELTGTVKLGGKAEPINLKLTPNEFLTVVVTGSAEGGPHVTLVRESPSDFNALKSSLALYNLDPGCGDGKLLAGDDRIAVISGVTPDKSGRRLVNPVNVALTVACDDTSKGAAVELGPMAAGERYSVFVFAASGPGRQAFAVRDEMAPFRP